MSIWSRLELKQLKSAVNSLIMELVEEEKIKIDIGEVYFAKINL